ncbi:hypothetical protein [Demequina sediminicola]|uniref:hypothetical protein n=1 Tax=Demequina sediminicola TaxID=1095026 RepID=UPI00128CC4CF|nr:hypothetical protein [Demequina sediminicola]
MRDNDSAVRSSTAIRIISAAPERVVLMTVALALAAGLAVTVGAHYWWTVVPGAIALTALGWRACAPQPATPRAALASGIALIGTIAWTVVNIAMAAEYVLVVRDPGFLSLSGLWLVDHGSTDIPAAAAIDASAGTTQIVPDANEAWNLKGDVVQPQGAKMLPATIAVGGWLAGETGVLGANAVIGAVGILAVFALARQFLSPMAALAPAGALALTVSHIGLSRPAYTEPLTLLLVIAGILWAWRGVAERSTNLLVTGAIASGATMLVRVDGPSYAIGALAGVGIALASMEADARWRRQAALTFAAWQAIAVGVGYLSVAVWSTEYLQRLADETHALLAVYAVLVLALAVWAWTWTGGPGQWLARLSVTLGRTGAMVAGGVIVAGLLVLASRPLWTTVHRSTDNPRHQFTNGVVESFQQSQGLPIEPTRTYAESTVTWLSYYLTWPIVILAILGLGWATMRMIRRDARWAVFVGAILAPTLLYLWRPSIVPDQIWAIRRFEPATLPGFILAAAAAGWAIAAHLQGERLRLTVRRTVGVAMLVLPLSTWISISPGAEFPVGGAVNVTTREMIGARDQIDDLCAVADGRPIALLGDGSHFGSLRVTCDVPVVLVFSTPTESQLSTMAQGFGETPVVVTRKSEKVTWTEEPTVAVQSTVKHSAYTLQGIPRSIISRNYSWYAGTVNADGSVTPITTGHTATAD